MLSIRQEVVVSRSFLFSFLLLSRFEVDAGFEAFFDAHARVDELHAVAVLAVVPFNAGRGAWHQVLTLGAKGFRVHNSFFLLFSSPVIVVINAVNNDCSDY